MILKSNVIEGQFRPLKWLGKASGRMKSLSSVLREVGKVLFTLEKNAKERTRKAHVKTGKGGHPIRITVPIRKRSNEVKTGTGTRKCQHIAITKRL